MTPKSIIHELRDQISDCAVQLLDAQRPMDFQIILGKLLEKAELLKLHRR